jgi:hypothetical protein
LTRKRLLNPPLNPKSTPFAGEEPWVKGWMSYRSSIMSRNHLSKRLVGFVLYILNKYSGENHERKDKYGMNYVYVSCKHISQNPNENHFLSFIGIPKTLFRWPNKSFSFGGLRVFKQRDPHGKTSHKDAIKVLVNETRVSEAKQVYTVVSS